MFQLVAILLLVNSLSDQCLALLDKGLIDNVPTKHIENWNFMVQIYRKQENGSMKASCAGSMISPEWIVTASHCLMSPVAEPTVKLSPDNVLVGFFKDGNWGTEAEAVRPLNIVKHHEFDFDLMKSVPLGNDIGLIHVPIQPLSTGLISLSKHIVKESKLVECEAAGWGGGDVFSKTLQHMKVDLVSIPDCKKSFPYDPVNNTNICTHAPEGGAVCNGDSGGPLVCTNKDSKKRELVGIVSYGDGYCLGKKPDIFTRVDRYLAWIKWIKASFTNV